MRWPLDLHFQAPYMGYLFLGLPLFTYWMIRADRKRKAALQLFKLHLSRARWRTIIIDSSYLLSFSFLVLALMDPLGYGKYPENSLSVQEGVSENLSTPVLFLLDSSLSMEVRDAPRGKSRLEFAKEIIDTTLDKLVSLPVGLQNFTSHLHLISPITYDTVYLKWLLQDFQIGDNIDQGSDFLAVLTELQAKLVVEQRVARQVIWLSDGEDTTRWRAGDGAQAERERAILQKVAQLKQEAVVITPVLVGSKDGGMVPDVLYENKPVVSQSNATLMMEMARNGSGSYFEAAHWSVTGLAEELALELTSSKNSVKDQRNALQELLSQVVYQPLFQIPLMVALLFLCLSQLVSPLSSPYAPRVRKVS